MSEYSSTDSHARHYSSVDVSCPQCPKLASIIQIPQTIPLFGEIILQTIVCTHCGFKWSDVMSVEMNEPVGYEARVVGEKGLEIKLVRNSSGTVEIPELGVWLEPASLSEGFFTNMEGLLERVENVLAMLLRSGTPAQKKETKKILTLLKKCKAGKHPFTVRVLDPFGGSALIGPGVKRFSLSKEELFKLKKGISLV